MRRLQGVQQAKRFLESAKLQIGGFELPVCWTGDEAAFAADLKQLEKTAEFAQAIGARDCFTNIFPASDQLPYHENFELHRRRLQAIAAMLERHQMRLGLGILAAGSHRLDSPLEDDLERSELLVAVVLCFETQPAGLVPGILDGPARHLGDLPEWGYDGSSTEQATGHFSDLLLRPVKTIQDPLHGPDDVLVLCEVLNPDGSVHWSNTRARLRQIAEQYIASGKITLSWPEDQPAGVESSTFAGLGVAPIKGRAAA